MSCGPLAKGRRVPCKSERPVKSSTAGGNGKAKSSLPNRLGSRLERKIKHKGKEEKKSKDPGTDVKVRMGNISDIAVDKPCRADEVDSDLGK